jgi:NAD+ diphosphatase
MSERADFLTAILPPEPVPADSLCFAFRGNRLLVRRETPQAGVERVELLREGQLRELGLRPLRSLFLGSSVGRPCFAWEADPQAPVPPGLEFVELRGLWGLLGEEEFWLAGRAFQILDWDRTHRYCGRCGAPMQAKTDERAKLCPACGLVSFPRVAPAIIVAVVRDRTILLARSHRFAGPMYSVLAGFVEPGESLEQCVHREVREEVGVEVRGLRYFASQPWPFPHSLMVAFTAEHAGGEIRIDDREIMEARWFPSDRLPRVPDRISIARRLIDWFVQNHPPGGTG